MGRRRRLIVAPEMSAPFGNERPVAQGIAGSPVRVLVVDDQPLFRGAVRDVVAAAPDFALAGEAESGTRALAATRELRPDLVLVAVRMAGVDGIATTTRLRATYPEAVVVLVTTEDPLHLPAEAGLCGAANLVRKQDLRPSLLRRLWRLHGVG